MMALAICLYILFATLALAFPLVIILFGGMLGILHERRKVVTYLRSLEDWPHPGHLATRIEARAHRGMDVTSLEEVLADHKKGEGR